MTIEEEQENNDRIEVSKISNQADRFTAMAAMSLVIGILMVGAAVAMSIATSAWPLPPFVFAVCLIFVSMVLYIIAQLLYIRANTEK